MRYLMIDRITHWKAGEKIQGVKNVAMSEDFLEWHFPKNPVMPGVLLIEAFAQLAGWLEAASSDFEHWFLMTRVRQCKFYGFALPGDQVELDLESHTDLDGKKKVYTGIGKVDGKKKMTIEFEGDVIPIQDLEELEGQKRFFNILTRKQ